MFLRSQHNGEIVSNIISNVSYQITKQLECIKKENKSQVFKKYILEYVLHIFFYHVDTTIIDVCYWELSIVTLQGNRSLLAMISFYHANHYVILFSADLSMFIVSPFECHRNLNIPGSEKCSPIIYNCANFLLGVKHCTFTV